MDFVKEAQNSLAGIAGIYLYRRNNGVIFINVCDCRKIPSTRQAFLKNPLFLNTG